jgi:diguanylate cyclase (GGDEF)-like protein
VDLEKLKSLQIIQCDNINFTLEMMHEDFNNFEKKIREKSSFDDVSKDIILKLNHYFPGHEINIFLRDSKSGELIRAIGFSQGQWQNLKDVASSQNQTYFENNQALNDKIRTSEKSFFEQEQLLLWCPLVCNRVFMGAILFQNDEGKVIEAELKGKIDFLLQSISLTFFHFKLYEMILTDSLTSLYNIRYLNRRLAEFIEQYKGSDIEATLAIVDIDFFKRINDNYGHNAGDEALKTISEKIRNNISQNAEAFRYGGEEFVILFTNLGPREVLASCERLRSEIMNIAFQYEEKKIPLTVSIGLAHFHKAIISEEEWFNQGDKALYRAKETGRNQSVVFQEEVFPNVSYFEQSKIQIHGAENLQPA